MTVQKYCLTQSWSIKLCTGTVHLNSQFKCPQQFIFSPACLQIKGRRSHAGTHDWPQPVDLSGKRTEAAGEGLLQSSELSVDENQ